MILYAIDLGATFGVFSAICWRLFETRRPCTKSPGCLFQWLLWLAVHLAIAVPMLIMMGDQWVNGTTSPLLVVIVKCGLTVLFLAPWRRREYDQ